MAPTNLVNLENVSRSFGIRQVLDRVSLGVDTGDRIGVVGLNGGGKTTLLEILAGIAEPDSGRVSRRGGVDMATVTQRTELDEDATVGGAVVGGLGLATHEWAGDPRVREILHGIGIHELGLETPVAGLSGGERRRVAIAAALVRDLDVLVLDEPTNHLDVEGVEWLARHLLSRSSALVVVTHDRWFLDTVATKTWEVVDGAVEAYEGGYNDWVFARAERARQAEAAESRRQNLMRKELAWLRRGAPARTSKPRYRVEAAEALISDVPPPRDTVELTRFATKRLGRVVIELEGATLETPDGRGLVGDLTWRLAPGERIGLVGVNGSGKTTLLRALAGDAPLAAGRRKEGKTVSLGWLRQELDDLPLGMRVLDAVEDVATRVNLGKDELSAGQLAERLGFSPKRQRTPIRDLSGGERRRLQLTRVLMSEPNVLLLDEPTNDLDIDTLRQLEDLLDSWAGTLVVISHDRYLVERICDSVWALFGDGELTHLPGGIDEYLRRRAAAAAAGDSGKGARAVTATGGTEGRDDPASSSSDAGGGGASAGSTSTPSAAEQRAMHKEMQKLERRLEKFASTEERLHAQLAEASEAVDTGRLAELDGELRALLEEKEQTEEAWMELGDRLEG